jgi:hypothetical protein
MALPDGGALLAAHVDVGHGFPIPRWSDIAGQLPEGLGPDALNAFWGAAAAAWLERMRAALGDGFEVRASDNFLLLAHAERRYADLLLKHAERSLRRILATLKDVAADFGYGQHVVMLFDDKDQYYRYVSNYYPEEGEFSLSSGMYVNRGYGHLVLVKDDLWTVEPIVAHELTHACLAHLPMPCWLNEGLAVNLEGVLSRPVQRLHTPAELQEMHREFWNAERIQEYWSGDSFHRPDEGNLLSYHLGETMVTVLSQDYEPFLAFAGTADLADAGDAAARAHLDLTLESLAGAILGDGEWAPDPGRWAQAPSRGGYASTAGSLTPIRSIRRNA